MHELVRTLSPVQEGGRTWQMVSSLTGPDKERELRLEWVERRELTSTVAKSQGEGAEVISMMLARASTTGTEMPTASSPTSQCKTFALDLGIKAKSNSFNR